MTNTTIPSESELRSIYIDSIRLLRDKTAADLTHLIDDNYSDDDTDYFPARAQTLSNLIADLTASYEYPLSQSIADTIASDDRLADLITCDFDFPLHALIRRLTNDFESFD